MAVISYAVIAVGLLLACLATWHEVQRRRVRTPRLLSGAELAALESEAFEPVEKVIARIERELAPGPAPDRRVPADDVQYWRDENWLDRYASYAATRVGRPLGDCPGCGYTVTQGSRRIRSHPCPRHVGDLPTVHVRRDGAWVPIETP